MRLKATACSLARSCKQVLARNAVVRRVVERHPGSAAFLARRFDRRRFRGLPLTALAAAFLYVVALFAGLVEDVLGLDPIVNVDHTVAGVVGAWRSPDVIAVFAWITDLCATPVVLTFMVVTVAIAWLCSRRFVIVGLLVSSAGASTLSALSKLTFQRARPVEAVVLETSYSFPSGHTTSSVAFYGFVGYLLIRSASSWGARGGWLAAALAVALLVGASRIVLGVHYLSDVMGGYLVGSMGLMAGIGTTEWLAEAGRLNWHAPVARHRAQTAAALLGLTAVGFAAYVYFRPSLA